MSPDLSIVIVSYQVRELMDRCLASLYRLARPTLEVWVVDNASSDNSAEWVREHYPEVRLIANSENRGFAAANNQALMQADGRYLMLLNPDTEVPEANLNALEQLVTFMDGHPRAGACGPRLMYGDGSFQHSAFGFPTLAQVYLDLFPSNWRLMQSRLNGRYPRHRYSSGVPFPVDHPLGAAFLVRREAAAEVGWLDEAFFIYVEEVDWAMRIRRCGWEIWCVPAACIVHHEARSTQQLRDRMFVELWRARLHFFRKHYGRAYNVALSWLVRAGMRCAAADARRAHARGDLGMEELERRQRAFASVSQLAKRTAG